MALCPKKFRKMSNQQKKSAFKRQLVNQYLTYEQFIWFSSRYYSQLQQEGKLDIVGLIEHVEGVTESEAIARCIGILYELQTRHAKVVELCSELLTEDPDLNELFDNEAKQN